MNKQGFSLDNFKKTKPIDNQIENAKPYWLDQSNEMIVKFYDRAISEFKRIKTAIESGENLSPRKRQIIKAEVTSYCGYDKSNLRKGRPAEKVSAQIDELNNELQKIWGKRNANIKKSPEKLLRSELEIQNRALKEQLNSLSMAAYSDYFDRWVEEYAKKDNQRMRARLEDVEAQNDDLREESLKLSYEIKRLRKDKYKIVK